MTDDNVIDGNVGTEYDEIDPSTMYFDGVPPTWTYEKLKELYDKGELEGNIDVASDGTVLNQVKYDTDFEYFKHFEFTRTFEILPNIFYEIETCYSENSHFEARRVYSVYESDLNIMFSTERSKEEVKEIIQKLIDSGIVKEWKGKIHD